jgi:hypothetical protein
MEGLGDVVGVVVEFAEVEECLDFVGAISPILQLSQRPRNPA